MEAYTPLEETQSKWMQPTVTVDPLPTDLGVIRGSDIVMPLLNGTTGKINDKKDRRKEGYNAMKRSAKALSRHKKRCTAKKYTGEHETISSDWGIENKIQFLSRLYISNGLHALLHLPSKSPLNRFVVLPSLGTLDLNNTAPKKIADGGAGKQVVSTLCNTTVGEKTTLATLVHSTDPFLFTTFSHHTKSFYGFSSSNDISKDLIEKLAKKKFSVAVAANFVKHPSIPFPQNGGIGSLDSYAPLTVHCVDMGIESDGLKRRATHALPDERKAKRIHSKETQDALSIQNFVETHDSSVSCTLLHSATDPTVTHATKGGLKPSLLGKEDSNYSLKRIQRRFRLLLRTPLSPTVGVAPEAAADCSGSTYYLVQRELAPLFEQLLWALYVLIPHWAYLEFSYKWHTTFVGEMIASLSRKPPKHHLESRLEKDRLRRNAEQTLPNDTTTRMDAPLKAAASDTNGNHTTEYSTLKAAAVSKAPVVSLDGVISTKPTAARHADTTPIVSKISLLSMKEKGGGQQSRYTPPPATLVSRVKNKPLEMGEHRTSSSTAVSSMAAASIAYPTHTIEVYLSILQPLCALLYPSATDVGTLLLRKGAVLLGSRNASRRSYVQHYLIGRLCQHFDSRDNQMDWHPSFASSLAYSFFTESRFANDHKTFSTKESLLDEQSSDVAKETSPCQDDFSPYTTSPYSCNLIFKSVIFKVLRDIDHLRSQFDPDFIGWTEAGLQAVVNGMQRPCLRRTIDSTGRTPEQSDASIHPPPALDGDDASNGLLGLQDLAQANRTFCMPLLESVSVLPKMGTALRAGVYWLPKDRKVRAEWRDCTRKKKIALSFSTVKYGEARAKYLAISGRAIGEIIGLCIPRNERQSVMNGMPADEKRMFLILQDVHQVKAFADKYLYVPSVGKGQSVLDRASPLLFPYLSGFRSSMKHCGNQAPYESEDDASAPVSLSDIASAMHEPQHYEDHKEEAKREPQGHLVAQGCSHLRRVQYERGAYDIEASGGTRMPRESAPQYGKALPEGEPYYGHAVEVQRVSKDASAINKENSQRLSPYPEKWRNPPITGPKITPSDAYSENASVHSFPRITPPVWNNVYFYAQRNQWRMSFKDPKTRKRSHKAFVCSKYGYHEAKKLAIEARIEAARKQGTLGDLGSPPDNSFWKDTLYYPMSQSFVDHTKTHKAVEDPRYKSLVFSGVKSAQPNTLDGCTTRSLTRLMHKAAVASPANRKRLLMEAETVCNGSPKRLKLMRDPPLSENHEGTTLDSASPHKNSCSSSNNTVPEGGVLAHANELLSSISVFNTLKTSKTASTTTFDDSARRFKSRVYINVSRGVKLEFLTPAHEKHFSEAEYGSLKTAREESEKWRKRMIKREQRRMQTQMSQENPKLFGWAPLDEEGYDKSSESAAAEELQGDAGTTTPHSSVAQEAAAGSNEAGAAATTLSAVDKMTLSLIRRRPAGAVGSSTRGDSHSSHTSNDAKDRFGIPHSTNPPSKSKVGLDHKADTLRAGGAVSPGSAMDICAEELLSTSSLSDFGLDNEDGITQSKPSPQAFNAIRNKHYVDELEKRIRKYGVKNDGKKDAVRDNPYKSVIPGVTFHHGKAAWRMRWVSTKTGRDTSRWFSSGELGIDKARQQAESMKLYLLKVGEAQGPAFSASTSKYSKLMKKKQNHLPSLIKEKKRKGQVSINENGLLGEKEGGVVV